MSLAFIDTETTGLDPDRHEIWEIALIVDDQEYQWFLPVDLGKADPIALNIGRFHERYKPPLDHDRPFWEVRDYVEGVCRSVADLTRGRHLVGAVPSFDEERLRKLLRKHGQCPMWHYHLIDVETLAVGHLLGYGQPLPELPWDSEDLSRAVAVDPDQFERHAALGDARWARAMFYAAAGKETE